MRSVVLCLLFLACRAAPADPPTKPDPSAGQADAPVVKRQKVELPADQKAVIDQAEASLAGLGAKSPTAKKLLAFYDQNAVTAVRLDGERLAVFGNARTRTWFLVAADPRLVALEGTHIFAEFKCHPSRGMMLTNMALSDFARGLMIAHELSHAQDCVLGGEPDSEPFSDVWLRGELIAHIVVSDVLEEWSGGEWDRLVHRSVERRQLMAMDKGQGPQVSVYGQLPEDIKDVRRVFGKEPGTTEVLTTQLDVEANIRNAQMTADARGVSPERRLEVLLDVTRGFYKSTGFTGIR